VENVVFNTSVVPHTAERGFLLSHTYGCTVCTRRPFHTRVCRNGQGTGFANLTHPLLIQSDQNVSLCLMILIQKVTNNVQNVPRRSPDIY
jgi:hypothetical protein